MKITIFGLAGSGTTTIAKMLCEKLDYNFMSTGNIFRSYAKQAEMDLYKFENTVAKNDPNFDIKLDNEVELYGKNNNNFVFESRLAWHFIPDSIKIFLDCEKDERYKRIQKRELGSLEAITFFNTRREQELEQRYKEVYPQIGFPPKKQDFDIYIDATQQSPEEILAHILQKIQ